MKFIHLIRCNIPLVASKQLWRTMRIFMVLMTVFLMQVSASTSAQQLTIKDSNISLREVFQRIRKQTGYTVLAKYEIVNKSKNLNLNLVGVPLEDALAQILEPQNLEFSIKEKAITIKEKEKSIIDRVKDYFAAIDVTGKVVDENGQPIAGATIKVKGSSLLTNSGNDGIFSLKNVDENAILEITYIGFQTRDVKVHKELGNIVLKILVGELEEVSINAGYYRVKERELTGSIARITAKDIENQPVTNFLATMQGRMAGVSVTQTTGTPGGGFDIKIRGQNSIRTDGNSPLYVVDGVPYSSDPIGHVQVRGNSFPTLINPLNSINPDQIESIEILKDADATAIYGSRGANGVVLISTKKAVGGQTSFSFNSTIGAGKATRFAEMMNTEEYLAMRRKAFANDKITTYPVNAYDLNGTWDQNRYTDWQKEFAGATANRADFIGSVTGGSVNTSFRVSGSYHSEANVLPGSFVYQKGGTQFNFNHRSEDQKFNIQLMGSYTIQNNTQPSSDRMGEVRFLAPNAPEVYNADGSLNWANGTWENLFSTLIAKFKSTSNDFLANTLISYRLLPGLSIKTSFGFSDLRYGENRINPSTIYDPRFNIGSANSSLILSETKRNSWILEPQINWETTVDQGKISFLIGTTFQNQSTNQLASSGTGFSSNSLIYNLAAATTIRALNDNETLYRYQAFFGRINYNLKERYILNITARRDGSSRFGPDRKYASFGAVGAAWILSKETFLDKISWLSFAKLRSSYGITGSDQIGDYQFLDTYSTSTTNYNNTIGLQPTRLFNPNFAWETNRKLEVALETGFFKDRIFFTAAWYRNRSSNQLVGVPLSTVTGFSSLQSNLDATVENSGWEFTLNSLNVNSEKLKWNSSINLTLSRNKLLSFPNLSSSTYRNIYRINQPLNIRLLYNFKGVDPQTGIYQFADINGDGRISSPDDKQIVADLTPSFFGGLQNEVSYGNWRFDFLLQFVKQQNQNSSIGLAGPFYNLPKVMTDSWQKPGDIVPYQLYTTGINSAASTASERYSESTATIVDASYIRLKNVSLSYQLPLKQKRMQCRLVLQGQNLLTFTNYKDGDPEFTTYGFLPPLKVFTGGIQLTL